MEPMTADRPPVSGACKVCEGWGAYCDDHRPPVSREPRKRTAKERLRMHRPHTLTPERLARALASSSERWGWSTHEFDWDQLADFIATEYNAQPESDPDGPPVSREPRTECEHERVASVWNWIPDGKGGTKRDGRAVYCRDCDVTFRPIETEASTGAALDVERLGFYDLLDVAEAILTKYPPSRLLCDHASPDLGPRTTAAVADLIRSARLAEQEGDR